MSAANETRQRAFTLFVNAYEEARRALSFLRWHENDLDAIAPSLYANRTSARKKANAPVVAPDAPIAGPAPAPAEGNGAPVVPTHQVEPNGASAAPGMPGHDPFGR